MITQAFLHCRGIGPAKLRQLQESGLHDWHSVLNHPEQIPFHQRLRDNLLAEIDRCAQALQDNDIHYLAHRLHPHDQWRLLGHFFHQASFFDIETTGLGPYDSISLIVCHHRGRIYHFMEDEGLEGFLDLLEEVQLLVSFNGASFDVPRLLDQFHIPNIPCPHVDARWVCYHGKYVGGLKAIARRMGIESPSDVRGLDGFDAVVLWNRWNRIRDATAKRLLLRYCYADVILLLMVAAQLVMLQGCQLQLPDAADLWAQADSVAV